MLYDLGVVPKPGSLLETVLAVVAQRRQHTRYLETRLLVETMLAPHTKGESKLDQSLERYTNSILPYMGNTAEKTDEEEQKILRAWTSQKGYKVKPLWMAKKNVPGRIRSALERGKAKVKEMENMRRSGRLKKM